MHTQFGSAWIAPMRPETAAPDVLAGDDEEDRPVLDAVNLLCLDFALQTGADLDFTDGPHEARFSGRNVTGDMVRLLPARAAGGGEVNRLGCGGAVRAAGVT